MIWLNILLSVLGILLMLFGLYEANWTGRYDRAAYYMAFACLEFILLYGGRHGS